MILRGLVLLCYTPLSNNTSAFFPLDVKVEGIVFSGSGIVVPPLSLLIMMLLPL